MLITSAIQGVEGMHYSKVFLVLVLIVVLLIGCAAQEEDQEAAGSNRYALIMSDQIGDKAFFDAAHEGLLLAESSYNIAFELFEAKHDSSMYSEVLTAGSEYGDYIIVIGYELYNQVPEFAKAYPENTYIFVDDEIEGVENVASVLYRQNEGAFLAGALAALMTQESGVEGINDQVKVGMVGGMDIPVIRNYQQGFEAGARYIRPDMEVHTVFAGDFVNTKRCYDKAEDLYKQGVDVIFAVAGGAGQGVFEAAEAYQRYAIGVDADQRYLSPDTIIASMKKNVGKSLYELIGKIENGSFASSRVYSYGLREGGVDLVYGEGYDPLVPESIQEEINAIKDAIKSGELTVK